MYGGYARGKREGRKRERERERERQREWKRAYDGRATLLPPLSTTEELAERVGSAGEQSAAPVDGREKYWPLFNFIFNLRLYLIKKYHETRLFYIHIYIYIYIYITHTQLLDEPG